MAIHEPARPQASRPSHSNFQRRLPIGAEVQPEGVHFRVWAPKRRKVAVALAGTAADDTELEAESDGYFSGLSADAGAGARYGFRLDDGERVYPDPASRLCSRRDRMNCRPWSIRRHFSWRDADWSGPTRKGQVTYELHALARSRKKGRSPLQPAELPYLADLGVTLVEVMPVAEFSGKFGWGYDGVDLFAPTRLYGTPDDFRRFVERGPSLESSA